MARRRRSGVAVAASKRRRAAAARLAAWGKIEREERQAAELARQLPEPEREAAPASKFHPRWQPWWAKWQKRPWLPVRRLRVPRKGWPGWMRARQRSAAADAAAGRDAGYAREMLEQFENALRGLGPELAETRTVREVLELSQERSDIVQGLAYWSKVAAAFDRYRQKPLQRGYQPERHELETIEPAEIGRGVVADPGTGSTEFDPATFAAAGNPRPPWMPAPGQGPPPVPPLPRRFGVFAWRGDGQYPLERAIKVYRRPAPAQKFADKLNAQPYPIRADAPEGYVVRTVYLTPAEIAALGNPAGAADKFEEWHEYGPDKVVDAKIPSLNARSELVFLGNLDRIDYTSAKWGKGRPGQRRRNAYKHKSTGRPWLMTNAEGTMLVIWDPTGKLKATADGIVN